MVKTGKNQRKSHSSVRLLSMCASPADEQWFWSYHFGGKVFSKLFIHIKLYFPLLIWLLKKSSSVTGFLYKWKHKCFSGLLLFILHTPAFLTYICKYFLLIFIYIKCLSLHWESFLGTTESGTDLLSQTVLHLDLFFLHNSATKESICNFQLSQRESESCRQFRGIILKGMQVEGRKIRAWSEEKLTGRYVMAAAVPARLEGEFVSAYIMLAEKRQIEDEVELQGWLMGTSSG